MFLFNLLCLRSCIHDDYHVLDEQMLTIYLEEFTDRFDLHRLLIERTLFYVEDN